MQLAASTSRPGPLARTVAEIAFSERRAHFRRRHRDPMRASLQRSDVLMQLIEDCREQGLRLVPAQIWAATVHFVGGVDSELRDELGINRAVDHVADIVFAAQERVQHLLVARREPTSTGRYLAPVIPLFG